MAFGEEVYSLLIAPLWLTNARTRILTLHGVAARSQYPKDWLIQDVLAEGLIHLAGGKVANVAGESTLNAV